MYERLKNIDVGLREINKRLDITNGKVALSKWIATTALSLIILVVSSIIGLNIIF